MNATEHEGPDRREGEYDRRSNPVVGVRVDGLSNGAWRIALWSATMLTTAAVAAVGWGIRTEIRDGRQDMRIEHGQVSDRVIDQALSEGFHSLSRADTAFLQELQREIKEREELTERVRALEAEQAALRRDYERAHGGQP